MSGQKIRPSRLYYLLAAGILAAGVGVFGWNIVGIVRWICEPSHPVVVPGQGEMMLAVAGKHTICYEYRTIVDGKIYICCEDLPELECTFADTTDGREIALEPMGMSYTYHRGAREGKGIWNVHVDRPGPYRLAASYPQDASGPEKVVLVVKRSLPPPREWSMMLISIPLLIACSAGAMAIFVVPLLGRLANKN